MLEFDTFIQSCIDKYTACGKCADNCVHMHYCIQNGCDESNCKECLKQIQWGKGLFTYECRKITFHYVLRFFYRFASEISYLMQTFHDKNRQVQNFVVYLRMIFSNTRATWISGYESMQNWFDKVREFGNDSFNTAAETIKERLDEVLNYFIHRATNASAESLNSKIKQFRAQLRGVVDIDFFLYRLSMIFG